MVKLRFPVVNFSLKTVEIGKTAQYGQRSAIWHKPPVLITATIVGLILVGALLWRSLNGPNYGQVAVLSPDTTPTTKLPEYTTLTTNYYSVNYSQRYSQTPSDIPPGGILDQKILAYNLGGQSGQSKIEIDIKAAPDGGITLDSVYDFYVKRLDRYKLTNKYYHGEAIDIARSVKGPPETAGMWLHGSFLMIIKLTTPDQKQNIDGELKDLLASVQWRDD
jgi:hypothetical protein